jgi:butyrate kinase
MSGKAFYVLAINFGSTSTKIGLYENEFEKMPIDLVHNRNVPSSYWGYSHGQKIYGAQSA